MARIKLNDIVGVVREHGETGSHAEPTWAAEIAQLSTKLDTSVAQTLGETTLSDLLDADDATVP